MFERSQVSVIAHRMGETKNPFMQVLVGPRQTGKSTMLKQALAHIELPYRFASADDTIFKNPEWLQNEWQQARGQALSANTQVVLVVDEIQKIPHWPDVVKGLYDADRRNDVPVKPILSGSSSLLPHKGLDDSLMGRFELIRSPHWSFAECQEAFGYSLDDFLFYGGYPASSVFVGDEARWRRYMINSVVEPTISQDVLELEPVRKPTLMRDLFFLGATYSSQELSYNKMLGQLQEARNTTTLSHYLTLLGQAHILTGLRKYHPKELERRSSSPRLAVYDTSLMTATLQLSKELLMTHPAERGHVVESAVGAYLLARAYEEGFEVCWWREGSAEVDFVLTQGSKVSAVEVKGGHESRQSGMARFLSEYPQAKRIVVGGSSSGSCSVEAFLLGQIPLFW